MRNWPIDSSCALLFVLLGIRLASDLLQVTPSSEFESTRRHMAILPRLLEVHAGALAGVVFTQLRERFHLRWLGSDTALALLCLLAEGALVILSFWQGEMGILNQGRIAAFYASSGSCRVDKSRS